MKKWIFLSSLVFAAPIFANHLSNGPSFAFAEALVWQISEANAANWAQILHPNSPNESIQFLGVPFKWSPALRIGAGFNGETKPWDLVLYYTGYQTQGSHLASTGTGEIHSAFSSNFYANNPLGNGISGPYYHHAEIQWDLEYNTLDLELGRHIEIDDLVDLRPFLGLKAGMIDQNMDSTWLYPYPANGALNPTFTSAKEKITNHFKGLGPSIGLDSAWHLYATPAHALQLIGSFSAAFLSSSWRFGDSYYNDAPQNISTLNDNLSSLATMAKAYLGLEWSGLCRRADWSLRLGFEEQVWFNQLQYYSFDMGKTNDALYLQGAVLGFGVHF